MRPYLREHLANERTFLAWLRTSIAVVAFGFVINKFSLYLKYLVPSQYAGPSSLKVSLVGTGLIWAGTVLVPISLWRFLKEQRDIDQPMITTTGNWAVMALAILLTAIGFYLSLTVGS